MLLRFKATGDPVGFFGCKPVVHRGRRLGVGVFGLSTLGMCLLLVRRFNEGPVSRRRVSYQFPIIALVAPTINRVIFDHLREGVLLQDRLSVLIRIESVYDVVRGTGDQRRFHLEQAF